jgi:hypothetical protein
MVTWFLGLCVETSVNEKRNKYGIKILHKILYYILNYITVIIGLFCFQLSVAKTFANLKINTFRCACMCIYPFDMCE